MKGNLFQSSQSSESLVNKVYNLGALENLSIPSCFLISLFNYLNFINLALTVKEFTEKK